MTLCTRQPLTPGGHREGEGSGTDWHLLSRKDVPGPPAGSGPQSPTSTPLPVPASSLSGRVWGSQGAGLAEGLLPGHQADTTSLSPRYLYTWTLSPLPGRPQPACPPPQKASALSQGSHKATTAAPQPPGSPDAPHHRSLSSASISPLVLDSIGVDELQSRWTETFHPMECTEHTKRSSVPTARPALGLALGSTVSCAQPLSGEALRLFII